MARTTVDTDCVDVLRAADPPLGAIEAADPRARAGLGEHVAVMRDLLFALCESAREAAPHDFALQVGLQAAANELGAVQQLLDER